MHQTKKGNEWRFGMKAHIGVDARTGLTHSFTTMPPTNTISAKRAIFYMVRKRLSLLMQMQATEALKREASFGMLMRTGI